MATKTGTRATVTRRKTTINKVNLNFYSPKGGPSFVAPPLWGSASGNSRHVLTDETRAQLAAISCLYASGREKESMPKGIVLTPSSTSSRAW